MKQIKKIPVFKTDETAESFVAEADLTEYDLSTFTMTKFEFKPQSKTASSCD